MVRSVLRTQYSGLPARPERHCALAVAISLALAGCSMSIPMFGSDDEPATTGSLASPVEVQEPLPQTLAYSDATKIGQAADAALWQAGNAPSGDWVNAATGSSGSVLGSEGEVDTQPAAACRPFSTIVTSIGGVHSYSGKICRGDDDRAVVQIESREVAKPL
jgi:surface antigen